MVQRPRPDLRGGVRSNAHSYRNWEPRVGNCPRPPGRSAYTKAIENLDRPIYVGDGVVVGGEISDTMSRALYFNRGNVQAAVGEHHNAVADFDEALRRGYSPVRDVRYNQGNSYFQLGAFEEAHQDFEAAWSERKGSDAALAMGNCKSHDGTIRGWR